MVKVVENGERICTVTLDGSESSIVFQNDYKYFAVKNESNAAVYVSLTRDIVEGADGVMTISSKESALFAHMKPHVNMFFVKGTGKIQVFASNAAVNPFKSAPVATGGGGKMPTVSNPNLLINPDFKINQRGISGTKTPDKNADGEDIHTYFVDRWGIDSGSVTINADGTLTLNGTMSQILENAVGTNVTASVSAGTAVYDDTTKTFTITGNGDIISWAKLEIGSAATPFVSPDTATELLKCQRYYFSLLSDETDIYNSVTGTAKQAAWIPLGFLFPTEMRAIPTVSILYLAKWNTSYANENTICEPHYTTKKGIPCLKSVNQEFVVGMAYYLRFSADAEIY